VVDQRRLLSGNMWSGIRIAAYSPIRMAGADAVTFKPALLGVLDACHRTRSLAGIR
jgi:hypothetical protein